MPFPNLKLIDSTMDYLENFVQDVLEGGNENQKNHLMKRLQKFINVHNFGKRPLDSEETESHQVNKKLKRSNVKLPNEIWIKIMNFLSTKDLFGKDLFGNFSLTCKLFHNLTIAPNAFERLYFENITDAYKFQKAVKILKRSKTLNDLSIICSDNFVNELLRESLKSSNKLKTIYIYNNDSNNNLPLTIVKLIKQSQNELTSLRFDEIYLSPKVMIEISKFKSLKELTVVHSSKNIFTPEVINALAFNSTQLEHLLFDVRKPISKVSETKEALENLFDKKKMTLKHLDIDLSSKTMPNTRPLRNLELCQNLQKLSVSLDLQDLHIISRLPKLETLILWQIFSADSIPDIESFRNTSNLKYLSFQDCDFAKEEFFKEFATLNFPVLERLYVRPKVKQDEIITEKTLKTFVNNAPNLKSVQFGENLNRSDITNSFLFDIFKKSQVFVIFGQLLRQILLENYFEESCHLEYKKYQKFKREFSRFCEDYGTIPMESIEN